VARVLANLGEPAAVPALIEAFENEKEPLAKMALSNALRDVTGVAADGGAQAWREWWRRWEARE